MHKAIEYRLVCANIFTKYIQFTRTMRCFTLHTVLSAFVDNPIPCGIYSYFADVVTSIVNYQSYVKHSIHSSYTIAVYALYTQYPDYTEYKQYTYYIQYTQYR